MSAVPAPRRIWLWSSSRRKPNALWRPFAKRISSRLRTSVCSTCSSLAERFANRIAGRGWAERLSGGRANQIAAGGRQSDRGAAAQAASRPGRRTGSPRRSSGSTRGDRCDMHEEGRHGSPAGAGSPSSDGIGAREMARLLKMGPNTERHYREALAAAGLLDGSVDELLELAWLECALTHPARVRGATARTTSAAVALPPRS